MTEPIDLKNYLARIGWTGPVTPTLDVLKDLAAHHVSSIPFENLDPFLGRPVLLDPESLMRKLLSSRRGGYCFEQNLLFAHALRAIGFVVSGLAARVMWNAPAGTLSPRTHMLLRVDVGGVAYVVDVGFGGQTLTGALELVADRPQPTTHEDFCLARRDDDWVMEAQIDEAWKPLYRFDTHSQTQGDYEISNYFLSTHPSSRFVTGLIASRADRDHRYALMNKRLVVHPRDGESEKRNLSSDEVVGVFESVFNIVPPDRSQLRAKIDALPDESME